MKILYLHQYFNTPEMGGGTRSFEMAKRLAKSGHEVHMITSWREDDGQKKWFSSKIDGIHIHWLPVPYSNNLTYNQRIYAFLKYAIYSAKKAREIGGDLVFATSTPLTICIPAVSIAKKLKTPLVFEVRDLWPELPIAIGAIKNPILKYLTKRLELYAYKHSKHIITLSPGMSDGVIQTGYPKNQVSMIPNSADLDLFIPDINRAKQFKEDYPELSNGFLVLYAGTLGAINGVGYLVDIAQIMKKTNKEIKFVIFGHGAEWSIIKKKAKKANVLDINFFLYPSIPKTELVNVFCAADVSTSLFIDLKEMESNSANKFFDTLSSGTPVAINYGGWHANLIKKYNMGVQLDRDPNIAAKTLIHLLNEKNITEMGGNARLLAEKKFSRDILAKQFEKVLLDACS